LFPTRTFVGSQLVVLVVPFVLASFPVCAVTMLSKSLIITALAGSAAAFSPSLHMSLERRDVVQGGAAAAAVVPFLGSVKPAEAFMQKNSMAPVITVFDHQ
jgi:hypothetical protein